MTEEIRQPMRKTWVKLFVDQILRGSLFSEMEDPAERFVWFGFLLLAGDSPFEGKIALTEDIGYTDAQIASMLKCAPRLITSAKRKMVQHEKIRVLPNNVIVIVNWKKYQSDYRRKVAAQKRKAYLVKKAPAKSPSKSPT